MNKVKYGIIAGLIGLGTATIAAESVTLGIFGYTTVTAPADDYKMLGSAFEVGEDGYTTLDEVLGTNGFLPDWAEGNADKVYIWDNSNTRYLSAYLNNDLWGATNPNTSEDIAFKWCYMDGGWPRPCALSTNYNLIPGDAIYLRVKNEVDVVVQGNVPTASTTTVTMATGYNLVMNPYPVDTDLSTMISTNDGAYANWAEGNADKIYVWDNGSQNYKSYFLNDGLWGDTNPNTSETISYRWCYMEGGWPRPANITISAGTGFFYYKETVGDMKWNANRPYSLD